MQSCTVVTIANNIDLEEENGFLLLLVTLFSCNNN